MQLNKYLGEFIFNQQKFSELTTFKAAIMKSKEITTHDLIFSQQKFTKLTTFKAAIMSWLIEHPPHCIPPEETTST